MAKVLRRLGVEVLEADVVAEVRPSAVVLANGAAFWFKGGSRPEKPAFDPVVVTEP